jgi:hypothetical protein
MCDYSLMHVKSRAANVGDNLEVKAFPSGSRGFVSPADPEIAVCVLPGTELAFEKGVEITTDFTMYWDRTQYAHRTAIFRQTDLDNKVMHHDALEFPDGTLVKLTRLTPGQKAIVLQLPAAPKTASEAKAQERLEVVA